MVFQLEEPGVYGDASVSRGGQSCEKGVVCWTRPESASEHGPIKYGVARMWLVAHCIYLYPMREFELEHAEDKSQQRPQQACAGRINLTTVKSFGMDRD